MRRAGSVEVGEGSDGEEDGDVRCGWREVE